MPLDPCSECGRNVQREKSHWITEPDVRVDAERAWPGGPVIYCLRCRKKRDKRAKALERGRGRKVVRLDA